MTHLHSICHICLLPIPSDIVTANHPLFGTRDHVIPLSRGGPDKPRNIAPAHYYCNQAKGAQPVTSKLSHECAAEIERQLRKRGWHGGGMTPAKFKLMHGILLCKIERIEELERTVNELMARNETLEHETPLCAGEGK